MLKKWNCAIRRRGLIAIFLTLLFYAGIGGAQTRVYAGEWDNAVTYYRAHGNNAVFCPVNERDGWIYFATEGTLSTSGTRYRTIGFHMHVRQNNGVELQSLYFQLGGKYLMKVNQSVVGKREYNLYAVSLSALKSRLGEAALAGITHGNVHIAIDSCMVVVRNKNPSGKMSDEGPTEGKVYCTYGDILSAAKWTSSSRESLKTYFGKSVVGLFHTLLLSAENGIKNVSGGGSYLHGTEVEISAETKDGWVFDSWSGSYHLQSARATIIMDRDLRFYAMAKEPALSVTYHRNAWAGDPECVGQRYVGSSPAGVMLSNPWIRGGYRFLGWSESQDSPLPQYGERAPVHRDWIIQKQPSLNLYGVWKENTYTIVFDNSGVEAYSVPHQTYRCNYSDSVAMEYPPGATEGFAGWSIYKGNKIAEYPHGTSVTVAELANKLGVTNTDGAVITLYAIGDVYPVIVAEDLYYSIDELRGGKVTEMEIASKVRADDREDGTIQYGIRPENRLVIENYDGSALAALEDQETVDLSLLAVDSWGHEVRKTIAIHAVDTTAKTGADLNGRFRFVSKKYADGAAGIPKDSVWFTDPDYYNLLRKAGVCP